MLVKDKDIWDRFWSKVLIGNSCWEWTSCLNKSGYGQFTLGKRTRAAHRVAWELTHGDITEKLHVLHSCDNPSCVRPSHLRLGTHQDNMKDREERGRSFRGGKPPHYLGEKNPAAKLTREDVLFIRDSKDSGVKLALRFGVSKTVISNVRNRKSWAHVTH